MMTEYDQLLDDLAAEQQGLEDMLKGIPGEAWATPTPAFGWAVQDQIYHLAMFDDAAALAATSSEAFARAKARIYAFAIPDRLKHAQELAGEPLFRWWAETRRRLLGSLRRLEGSTRVEWFGPSMSAHSFGTARLMEAWAHGQDVADALGIVRNHTDRVRHIAHLGVITKKWSFVNRKLTPPHGEIRVELMGPSGVTWTWGPAAAPDRITGEAVEFALVVTQRANIADTRLGVEGEAARSWMEVAQCFAGPPTIRPAAG